MSQYAGSSSGLAFGEASASADMIAIKLDWLAELLAEAR